MRVEEEPKTEEDIPDMEILSVEFAQAILIRITDLRKRDRFLDIKNHEEKLKKEATDDVFRQFVAE